MPPPGRDTIAAGAGSKAPLPTSGQGGPRVAFIHGLLDVGRSWAVVRRALARAAASTVALDLAGMGERRDATADRVAKWLGALRGTAAEAR